MHLYTVAQMREAEQRAATEYGISLSDLMDNAGKALARAALAMCPAGVIGIFCGNGNNGGDGYVCAAELLRRGRRVIVWGIGAEALPEGSLAKNAADEFQATGGVILPITLELDNIKCDLIVDALLGTGLIRQVSGLYEHAIRLINAAPAPVLACDLPSGVDGDTGEIMGVAVQADKTLMMGLGKLACALSPGSACFGQAEVCDIGLPEALVAGFMSAEENRDKLHLSLESLDAGWAEISISNESTAEKFIASHVLYDTLSDLIEIAICLFKGQSCKKRILLEPDEITIEAVLIDSEEVVLKIKETTFICSLQRYARQVLKLFDSYQHKHGAGTYGTKWHHDFPSEKLEALRKMLRSKKETP